MLIDCDPLEIARQLTIRDHALLRYFFHRFHSSSGPFPSLNFMIQDGLVAELQEYKLLVLFLERSLLNRTRTIYESCQLFPRVADCDGTKCKGSNSNLATYCSDRKGAQ